MSQPLIPKKVGSDRELAPTGSHRAVLYKLVNLGTLETEWEGKKKMSHKIRLIWELSDEVLEYEYDDKETGQKVKKSGPFAVGGKYTYSLGDNSRLLPVVQGMLGTNLTEDERWTFDAQKLLGMPCLVTVIHDEYEGTKFAKVASVTSLPKAMAKPAQINETIIWDVRELSQEAIAELPEYIRKDMEASQEYHVRFLAPRSEQPREVAPGVPYPESDEMPPF